jgi:hypothetical protein
MNNEQDKEDLLKLSTDVAEKLHSCAPFNINPNKKPYETNTNGWLIKLGKFKRSKCRIEIWFDLFTAHKKRKVYYGVSSNDKKELSKIIRTALINEDFGEPLFFNDKDCEMNKKYVRLAKQLTETQFGYPVYEQYSKDSNEPRLSFR